jgi:hypothetical protein
MSPPGGSPVHPGGKPTSAHPSIFRRSRLAIGHLWPIRATTDKQPSSNGLPYASQVQVKDWRKLRLDRTSDPGLLHAVDERAINVEDLSRKHDDVVGLDEPDRRSRSYSADAKMGVVRFMLYANK